MLLLSLLAAAFFFSAAGIFLIKKDPLKSSEAIVILSGGGNERLEKGASLVNDGIAKRIILTDTDEIDENGVSVSTANMNKLASQYGLSKTRIIVTRRTSTNTYEEAQAVLSLMQQREWKNLIVVTDSFHSRRTSMIFNHVFKSSGIRLSVQPVDVEGYWYHPFYWWRDADSFQATILEYLKIVYFLTGRYG